VKSIKPIWGRIERPPMLLLVFIYLFAAWAGLYGAAKVVWAFVRYSVFQS